MSFLRHSHVRVVLVLLLFSIAISASDRVHAQTRSYSMDRLIFVPPIYYVGDRVEVRFRIDTEGYELPSEVDQIPEDRWIRIDDIRIIPIAGSYDIRITFTSFRPGLSELPKLTIGELTIERLQIETASIRENESHTFYGMADPLILPGTRLFIALVAGVVLFGPLSLIIVSGWLRGIAKRIVASIGTRRPYRGLLRSLDSLDASSARLEGREFYGVLFVEFRRYLSSRSDHNYSSTTTREMTLLGTAEFATVPEFVRIGNIVGRVDRVKFGGASTSESELREGLDLVRSAAETIETLYRASRRR